MAEDFRMADESIAYIAAELGKASQLIEALTNSSEMRDRIARIADTCSSALESKRKIMIAGNGGSAADAQHWAGELVSRFHHDRPGLPAIALTTDTSILTAIGNDYGYDYVFARQIEALATKGDVFIGLSTSGTSPSILRAFSAAREHGVVTIGMTGSSGGHMAPLCDICLNMPSDETPHIQEGHEIVGHILCGLIERRLFPQKQDQTRAKAPHERAPARS